MGKIISIDKLKNKGLQKKNIIYIIFIIILIYIFYSIYLLMKTPNETITVEKRNVNTRRNNGTVIF